MYDNYVLTINLGSSLGESALIPFPSIIRKRQYLYIVWKWCGLYSIPYTSFLYDPPPSISAYLWLYLHGSHVVFWHIYNPFGMELKISSPIQSYTYTYICNCGTCPSRLDHNICMTHFKIMWKIHFCENLPLKLAFVHYLNAARIITHKFPHLLQICIEKWSSFIRWSHYILVLQGRQIAAEKWVNYLSTVIGMNTCIISRLCRCEEFRS